VALASKGPVDHLCKVRHIRKGHRAASSLPVRLDIIDP